MPIVALMFAINAVMFTIIGAWGLAAACALLAAGTIIMSRRPQR